MQLWRTKAGEITKWIKKTRRDWQEKEKRFGERIHEAVVGVARKKSNPYWNTKNLGFDTWIVALVIVLILFVFLLAR